MYQINQKSVKYSFLAHSITTLILGDEGTDGGLGGLSALTHSQVVSFLPKFVQELLDFSIKPFKLAGLLKNFIL